MKHNRQMATASVILGVLGIVLSLVLVTMPYIPLALSVLGLILAVCARRSQSSIASGIGFVLGIVGIVLSGVYMIMWISCTGFIGALMN